ncbi:hypothetical protein DVS74_009165 [Xylella fastidiosa subsp. multiplex]|nr:hypothetical protein DVS74_009165 [Xylella fastidiosa subsp. multiplex]
MESGPVLLVDGPVHRDPRSARGARRPLVVGVPLLWRRPVDYFFWLTDESGLEMDPMRHDDLGERCLLFVGLKEQVRP